MGDVRTPDTIIKTMGELATEMCRFPEAKGMGEHLNELRADLEEYFIVYGRPDLPEPEGVVYGVTGADTLRTHVRVLARLLDEPHYDLPAWREHICERIKAIGQFGLPPLDRAAPELLAACQRAFALLEPSGTQEDIDLLKAAITKAEGR